MLSSAFGLPPPPPSADIIYEWSPRLRLHEIDAEWVVGNWDSQFTECGDIPADYDDDVLSSAEDVLKILKKVSNALRNPT